MSSFFYRPLSSAFPPLPAGVVNFRGKDAYTDAIKRFPTPGLVFLLFEGREHNTGFGLSVKGLGLPIRGKTAEKNRQNWLFPPMQLAFFPKAVCRNHRKRMASQCSTNGARPAFPPSSIPPYPPFPLREGLWEGWYNMAAPCVPSRYCPALVAK